MYEPRCPLCSSQLFWSSDFDAEDFGYEYEGVVGCYTCSNEECGTHVEVRDLYIDKETEERSFKYYILDYADNDVCNYDLDADVEHCIYCGEYMETIETKPHKEDINSGEGVLTIKKCNCCSTVYEIEDVYPLEDIYNYPEDYLTPYDLRTVIIK